MQAHGWLMSSQWRLEFRKYRNFRSLKIEFSKCQIFWTFDRRWSSDILVSSFGWSPSLYFASLLFECPSAYTSLIMGPLFAFLSGDSLLPGGNQVSGNELR